MAGARARSFKNLSLSLLTITIAAGALASALRNTILHNAKHQREPVLFQGFTATVDERTRIRSSLSLLTPLDDVKVESLLLLDLSPFSLRVHKVC